MWPDRTRCRPLSTFKSGPKGMIAMLSSPKQNPRKSETIMAPWQSLVKPLERQGVQPNLFILDNIASADMKSAMTLANYTYQLVPPENHRKNPAKRAIQTFFKNHFLAGITSLPADFLLSEWDCLLEQAELTILLLRSAHINPKLSAYAYLFDDFDFNHTPLAPPSINYFSHLASRVTNLRIFSQS